MITRVLTLRYSETLHGFPEEPVKAAMAGHEVLSVKEHFFEHSGVPHVALVMLLNPGEGAGARPADFSYPRSGAEAKEDPEAEMTEAQILYYRSLKKWRNETTKASGVPAWAAGKNVQFAEVVKRAPQSIAELREIDGFSEAYCRKYGKQVLELTLGLREALEKERAETAAKEAEESAQKEAEEKKSAEAAGDAEKKRKEEARKPAAVDPEVAKKYAEGLLL